MPRRRRPRHSAIAFSLSAFLTRPSSRPTRGAVLWMMGALASFLSMALAGRELSAELTVFQTLSFRSSICLLVVLVLLARFGWERTHTSRAGLHVVRNLAHFGGQFGWFTGIAAIPLAEVFAIEFTTPVWTAVLATIFLGERLTARRMAGVALGFAGILVILRPGVALVHPAALAVLGGALGYATTYVITKALVRTERPLTILFYMNLVQLPLGLAGSIWHWVWPSPALWPWVLIVGVTGLSSHYCLARALALADATIVAPLDFLRLPLVAVIGFAVYGEPLAFLVFLGATFIFAGNYLNLTPAQSPRSG